MLVQVKVMVFNATFSNISVLLVEKTTNLPQVTDKLLIQVFVLHVTVSTEISIFTVLLLQVFMTFYTV